MTEQYLVWTPSEKAAAVAAIALVVDLAEVLTAVLETSVVVRVEVRKVAGQSLEAGPGKLAVQKTSAVAHKVLPVAAVQRMGLRLERTGSVQRSSPAASLAAVWVPSRVQARNGSKVRQLQMQEAAYTAKPHGSLVEQLESKVMSLVFACLVEGHTRWLPRMTAGSLWAGR